MIEGQEARIRQTEIQEQLKRMVENESDAEEVDDVLKELLGEVKKEKQEKMEGKQNKNVLAKKEEDVDQMLADLGLV